MPIYDDVEGCWNLFYVAYRAAPNTAEQWRINHDGHIWRAVARQPGLAGVGGPYEDLGIAFAPGPGSDPWEGLRGTNSFVPYRADDGRWHALYGSATTETRPVDHWLVGLASAPRLVGPWVRCTGANPLPIGSYFVENPIVTRLADGRYVAVYDNGDALPTISVTYSEDGVILAPGTSLAMRPSGAHVWVDIVRPPLGLVPESGGTFTLLYTGYRAIDAALTPDQPYASASGSRFLRLRPPTARPDRGPVMVGHAVSHLVCMVTC